MVHANPYKHGAELLELLCNWVHNIPMCSAVMGTAGRDSTTSLEAGGA